MMGFAMVTLDAPVTKTSSSILAFKEDIVTKSLRLPALTVEDASMYVQAVSFHPDWQISPKSKDEASFVAWNGLECVECGSCSYVCPAKRQLKQSIGSMRKISTGQQEEKNKRGEKILNENYNVSSSPHIRDKVTSSNIMLMVVIALLPATFFWNL